MVSLLPGLHAGSTETSRGKRWPWWLRDGSNSPWLQPLRSSLLKLDKPGIFGLFPCHLEKQREAQSRPHLRPVCREVEDEHPQSNYASPTPGWAQPSSCEEQSRPESDNPRTVKQSPITTLTAQLSSWARWAYSKIQPTQWVPSAEPWRVSPRLRPPVAPRHPGTQAQAGRQCWVQAPPLSSRLGSPLLT